MVFPSVVTLIPGTSDPLKLIDSISLNAGISTKEALLGHHKNIKLLLNTYMIASYLLLHILYVQLHKMN